MRIKTHARMQLKPVRKIHRNYYRWVWSCQLATETSLTTCWNMSRLSLLPKSLDCILYDMLLIINLQTFQCGTSRNQGAWLCSRKHYSSRFFLKLKQYHWLPICNKGNKIRTKCGCVASVSDQTEHITTFLLLLW